MSADASGSLVLAAYAVGGLLLLWRRIRSYNEVWQESLFTLAIRSYVPFMFGQRYRDRCPWPETGSVLIVANHSSPTDPIMIHSASLVKRNGVRMRTVEWLTAREYCERPGVVGALCQVARSIPVSRHGRDMAAVREALKRSKQGRVIGIFPEGALNDGKSLREFHTGVAFLALAAKVPVYPVFVENAPRGDSMVAAFLKRTRARVHFGGPIDLSEWMEKRRPSQDDLEAVTRTIRNALAVLGGLPIEPESRIAAPFRSNPLT